MTISLQHIGYKLLIALICLLQFPTYAQHLASHMIRDAEQSSIPRINSTDQQPSNTKLLEEVLSELEQLYEVDFAYEGVIIADKHIKIEDYELFKKEKDFDEALQQLLKPLTLTYKKFEKYYVIQKEDQTSKPVQKIDSRFQQNAINEQHLLQILPMKGKTLDTQWERLEKTITGQVTDENDEPLPGVNILVKNTTTGTVTDIDGNYRLSVLDDATTLVFSSVGYITEEVEIGGRSVINIQMVPDVQALSEIVVVGYGTQEKENLTGSVASVGGDDLIKRPVLQTASALQGIMPGVTVTQESGQPGRDGGTIRIRGVGSFGSGDKNDPLVLVDGIETSINGVDPNDIESITVLKDAASASIYGSRAANGVILITTKRGKEGAFSVNYNGYAGWQSFTELPDFLGSADYMRLYNEASVNDGVPPVFTDDEIASVPSVEFPEVDWQEEVFKDKAFQQHHNLSVAGGSEKISARGSVTLMDQHGLVPNTDYVRYGLRLNTDIRPIDKLRFGADISLRQSNATEPTNGSRDNTGIDRGIDNIVRAVHRIPPIYAAQLPDGKWGPGWNGDNPKAWVNDGGQWDETWREVLVNLSANVEPVDGFNLNFTFSPRFDNTFRKTFTQAIDTYTNDGSYFTTVPAKSALNLYDDKSTQIYVKALATYEKDLGAHFFKVLAGFDQNEFEFRAFNAFRDGFPLPDFPELPAGSLLNQQNDGSTREWSLRSYFGRLNYNFKERYLLEANVRYDGSSRFAKGNQWGFFPSFSAGWRVSEEAFMDAVDLVSNLKLRASWGQLGNQQIGTYPYQSTVALGTGNYTFGGTAADGAALTDLANKDITWEETEMTNFGLDLGMWDDRLEVVFDYYVKNTEGILLQLNIPKTIGLGAPFQNAAKVRNTGWDLGITHRNKIRDFGYRVGFVLSDVKNEVLNMANAGPNIEGRTIITEGEPINALYGYQTLGLFQTQEEVDEYATQFGNVGPGDIKYNDQNGDGQITADDDRIVIGNQIPRFTYSLTLAADYKGFDISVFLQGVGKKDGYLSGDNVFAFTNASKVQDWHLDRWTPENPNASYPRFWINAPNNGQNSSYWVRDASYLRVKTVQLGYTFPEGWLSNNFIQNLRVYASGQNLFTIDDFLPGYDPEAPVGAGYFYPMVSTYTFGLNVTF